MTFACALATLTSWSSLSFSASTSPTLDAQSPSRAFCAASAAAVASDARVSSLAARTDEAMDACCPAASGGGGREGQGEGGIG